VVVASNSSIINQLSFVHSVTGVTDTQKKLNPNDGNVKVGVVDSGVDYHHSALGECFGSG
jgi:hypothetical protein